MRNIIDFYTPIEEAKKEIWERWNNASLRKQVEEYLGGIPKCFISEPRAVLDRNIVSPN